MEGGRAAEGKEKEEGEEEEECTWLGAGDVLAAWLIRDKKQTGHGERDTIPH